MCKKINGFHNLKGLPIPTATIKSWCKISKDKPETISNEVNNLFFSLLEKQDQERVISNDLNLLSKAKLYDNIYKR
jgi:hypothetical protein